jgi:hypothetical protein
MNDRTKTGLQILQAAFLMGVLGNLLLRQIPWGLNAFLFVTAFVAAMAMMARRRRPELLTGQNIAVGGAMVFFSAMFLWRDSEELMVYDTLAIIVLMGVLMLSSLDVQAKVSGVFHYAAGTIWAGVNSVFAPAVLLSTDVKWDTLPRMGWSRHIISAVRGVMIAVPLMLVFGGLFMAADAAYAGIVERVFNIAPETVFTHILLTAIFFWLTAGFYRGLILGFQTRPDRGAAAAENAAATEGVGLSIFERVKAEDAINPDALPDNATILEHINKSDPPHAETGEPKLQAAAAPVKKAWQWQTIDNSAVPQAFTLGVIETSIVLGLTNLLFLSFVIVQVPYLFGGMELVQNTPDFKLAEYARRGFGELVAVTVLVLPILLASHWLLRKENPLNEKIYRVLAGIQIVLLFVIMASAMQRLFLLTGNLGYGLTTVRFYPMVVMIWFAIVFIWFGLTVLRGRRQYFAWGALWSALFVLATVHVIDPDDLIARTNLRLMHEGREFDGTYNARLSADAVPALIESLGSMSYEDQCEVKWGLRKRLGHARNGNESDLRSFNLSRNAARAQLESIESSLSTAGCPAYVNTDSD